MSANLVSPRPEVRSRPTAIGTIRRRLLVNALVHPDEASAWLPQGIRPHVTELGTVVGCCLLEIDSLRLSPLPVAAGISLRAAAHRISVEWCDGSGEPTVGVYVPVRLTDSSLAVALGGRLFPGVHRSTPIHVHDAADMLTWAVGAADEHDVFGIRVAVSKPSPGVFDPVVDVVGTTCLGATAGLSPNRRGELEAVIMRPESQAATRVEIQDLHSAFLNSFASAQPAPAFLMQDVGVTWSPGQNQERMLVEELR